MKLAFEDIEDILFDGSAEQMSALAEHRVGYRYYPATGNFEISVGSTRSKGYGVAKQPNCVGLFGDAHTF